MKIVFYGGVVLALVGCLLSPRHPAIMLPTVALGAALGVLARRVFTP